MKKRILSILIILVVSLGMFIFPGCLKNSKNDKDSYSKIKKRGYVIIGLDDTFVPMGFKNSKNEIVGFDVDLAKEVFKRLGLKIKFQPIDWSMKETELNEGNIDMIWNGYTITDERKKKVSFTDPYLSNRQIIITMANSNINKKSDLKGKRVATQSGSSSIDEINKEPELAKSFAGGKPVLFETNNDALMDLEAGRSDAIVADELYARYCMKERGEKKYKVLAEDFGKEQNGVGFRKTDKKLLENVNKILKDLKNDGTRTKICIKWFGKDLAE